jgi:hypothetical protein
MRALRYGSTVISEEVTCSIIDGSAVVFGLMKLEDESRKEELKNSVKKRSTPVINFVVVFLICLGRGTDRIPQSCEQLSQSVVIRMARSLTDSFDEML